MNEEMFQLPEQQCQVLTETYTHVKTVYDIILDEDIREPSYYRDAFHVLRTANEHDLVRIIVNSDGGHMSSAVAFRNAISECGCPVFAIIEGACHSSAAMISLSCDDIEVKPFSSNLNHNVSYGSAGSGSDIKAHVEFTSRQTEKFICEVYKHYLSESEIEDILQGRQLWLDDDQMRNRWEVVKEAREAEWEKECSEGENLVDEEPLIN